ncbi:MAG: F0F1 ATP synthase subunit B [Candidatus Tritonobacter lacicola]|nr:F0F1 ATP synthase subunit B [Candidatus Tritonobacter lacicola]
MISLNITILITVINFAVLLWLFKRFLLKPMVGFLDKRSGEIAAARSEAREDRSSAGELLKETRDGLKKARLEAGDIVKEARLDGRKEQAKIVAQAKEEAGRMMERAGDEIGKKVEDARSRLKKDVAGLSIDIAEKLLERSVNVEDHERTVTEFMEELEERK